MWQGGMSGLYNTYSTSIPHQQHSQGDNEGPFKQAAVPEEMETSQSAALPNDL
jgi:hypothetical protein